MNTNQAIGALLDYGQARGLFRCEDRIYTRNLMLDVLGLDAYRDEGSAEAPLEEVLRVLLDDGRVEGHVSLADKMEAKSR